MGLYGDILRASDGSIFTFDQIYTIKTGFFEKWLEEFNKILDIEDLSLISDAWSTLKEAEEETVLQEAADYARYLSQAQVMAIMKGLANTDNVFVGRYVFVEGVCWVFTKIYRNGQYEYVKVADLSTLNLLNEANTDEWIDIQQNSAQIGDIKLVHADPAPPVITDRGNGSPLENYFSDRLYPITRDDDGENPHISSDYFWELGNENTDVYGLKRGSAQLGILFQYMDAKGHQVKTPWEYEEKYVKIQDFTVFDNQLYYVPFYYPTVVEEDEDGKKVEKPVTNVKYLLNKNTEYYTSPLTNQLKKREISGYIKLTHWNTRNDTYKGLSGEGIAVTSYNSDYYYYMKIISRIETEDDITFTHLVSEKDEYTLILNGGAFLGGDKDDYYIIK